MDNQGGQEEGIKQRLRSSPRYPKRTPVTRPIMAEETQDSAPELGLPEPVEEQQKLPNNNDALRTEFKALLATTKHEMAITNRDMMREMVHEITNAIKRREAHVPEVVQPTVEQIRDSFTNGGSQSNLSTRPEFQNNHSHSTLSSRPEFQGERDPPGEIGNDNQWPYSGRQSHESQPNETSYNPRANTSNYIKLPPFTGKERWDIWYNRFMDVAKLRRWDEEQSLLELLPRLQGPAGEFVYGQLGSHARRNYGLLVQELNSRFRVVETSKTYRALFSNRDQRHGESPEAYAAELKRLYDKAYPNRDMNTRTEDLVRRFLDGINDEAARFHIEYIKEPIDIDHAVYETVNFLETKRRQGKRELAETKQRRPSRLVRLGSNYDIDEMVAPSEDDCDDEEDEDSSGRIARAPKRTKRTPITNIIADEASKDLETPIKTEEHLNTKISQPKDSDDQVQGLDKVLNKILSKLETLGKPSASNTPRNPRVANTQNQGHQRNRNNTPRTPRRQYECYNCGILGHFARECPTAPWVAGMQMTMQPGVSNQPIPFSHNTNRQGTQGDHSGQNYRHMNSTQAPNQGPRDPPLN